MMDWLLLVATCTLATLGFALIATSQKQHRPHGRPSGTANPVALRLAGALLIGLSTVPAVLRDGWAFGLLVWATILTLAALLIVAWLSQRRDHRGGTRQSP